MKELYTLKSSNAPESAAWSLMDIPQVNLNIRLGDTIIPISDTVLVLLILSVVFVIFQLFYLRSRKKYLAENKKLIQYKVNGFLSDLLFADNQSESYYDSQINAFRVKIPLHKSWCKDLMIQNIIDLGKNIKGDSKSGLLSVYFKLGLQGYTERLLRSNQWYLKSKAVYYWRELNYSNAADKIYPLISHSNHELRSSALLAYISLAELDPLHVLEEYTDNISHVEGLNILDVIQRKKIKKPENLSKWLEFEEDSHLIFALKLVAYYNDLNSGLQVVNLLTAPNPKVRLEAIKTIGKLFYFDAEQSLIDLFEGEEEENQIEIIHTLKGIGGNHSLEFIHQLLKSPRSAELQIAALFTLKSLDQGFSKLDFGGNQNLLKAKKHVEDPHLTQ